LFGLPDFVQVLLLLLQHKIAPLHMELQYRGFVWYVHLPPPLPFSAADILCY
jgi:hypothetical protein